MTRVAFALVGLLVLAPAGAAADPAPPALRVTAEAHAGLLSVAAGTGLGLLLSNAERDCGSACKGAWTMVGAVFGLFASPFATWGTSRLLGGQGDLLATWVGLAAGMQLDALVTALVHKLVGNRPDEVPLIAWVLAGALAIGAPLAGLTLGAEY